MKTSLHPFYALLLALSVVGCAAPNHQPEPPVQLAQNATAALPTFADSELAKLPGVQATMDRCREQGKKHKVTTRVLESGPMKGNLTIDVSCEE
jgi:hypothetical protein